MKSWKLRITFFLLAVALFGIMFLIPVISIPGNTIFLHSTLLVPADYIMLAAFSILSSLLLIMQFKIFDKTRQHLLHGDMALSGAGVLAGIVSSLFASASCAICIGALLSFLGFSTILFLAQHRWYIMLGALALLLISLYLSSRRFNKGCEVCVVTK